MVRGTGLEPARLNHTPLKRARLPIPPLSQMGVATGAATFNIISKEAQSVNTYGQNFLNFFHGLST